VGAKMWNDYSQRNPDDVGLLEARLNRLFRTVPTGHTPSRISSIAFNPLRLLQVFGNSFRALIEAPSRGNARPCDHENTTPRHLNRQNGMRISTFRLVRILALGYRRCFRRNGIVSRTTKRIFKSCVSCAKLLEVGGGSG
jgi:hypothetical protein